jgi:hypothetical protein
VTDASWWPITFPDECTWVKLRIGPRKVEVVWQKDGTYIVDPDPYTATPLVYLKSLLDLRCYLLGLAQGLPTE